MFNCTARGVPIRWSVFTPNMNYTNLQISNFVTQGESMDGVIMADLISLDSSSIPITIVSSLTVNITAELEEVKCSVRESQLIEEIERLNQDSFILQVISLQLLILFKN